MVKKLPRAAAGASFGGIGYGLLEILYRGYTHISMILLGGACFLFLLRLSKSALPLAAQCILGGSFITLSEFFTGLFINLQLGLDVWDYSEESFHFLGQVCPRFFLNWCLLCLILLPLCRYIRQKGPLLRYSLIAVRYKIRYTKG